mgnify:CR=1 FL=1
MAILKLLTEVFVIYYLPVLLILFNIIPFEFRFGMLVIITSILIVYSLIRKKSLKSLGIRLDNLKQSLILNLSYSAIFVLLMLTLYYLNMIREPTLPKWSMFFLFYVFISSPSQEFLYRSYLFNLFDHYKIKSNYTRVLFSSFTYAFLHLIYLDFTTFLTPFLIGIGWGIIYQKYPNLIGVSISHAILGVVSILVGLI